MLRINCPIFPSLVLPPAEESQGEIEVKDPCACENLVEFQQATMSSLEQFTQKHILLLKIKRTHFTKDQKQGHIYHCN